MEQNSTYTFNLDYTKYECSYLHFTGCSGSVFNFVKDFMKSFREKFCATINFYLKLLKVIPANNIFVHFVLFLSFLIAFIFLRHLILSPWHKIFNGIYYISCIKLKILEGNPYHESSNLKEITTLYQGKGKDKNVTEMVHFKFSKKW